MFIVCIFKIYHHPVFLPISPATQMTPSASAAVVLAVAPLAAAKAKTVIPLEELSIQDLMKLYRIYQNEEHQECLFCLGLKYNE